MKKKKVILSLLVMWGIMLLPMQTKAAVLQGNPNTNGQKTYTATDWMTYIRNMETSNQAMGLGETIDATTKKASTSNNIDVHMIKTTEWGAMAILSASGYGNSKKIQESDIKSTTGNKSGVYVPLTDWECTAGGLQNKAFIGVDGRYYDTYTDSYTSAKTGDGLGKTNTNILGCAKWQGGKEGNWVAGAYPYFLRGSTALFSFGSNVNSATPSNLGRAAVVCGDGF